MLKKKVISIFLAAALALGGSFATSVAAESENREYGAEKGTENGTGTEAWTDSETESRTEADPETELWTETGTEADPETEQQTETGTEAGPETEQQTETGTEADPETEQQTETGTEAGPETETQTEGTGALEAWGGQETEAESQPDEESAGMEGNKTPELKRQAARAAKTTYYAGYQVRLEGAEDTQGALAGLTFTLYEKEPGGVWKEVSTKQSEYTSYYHLTFVYFTRFSVEGSPVNEYKVVMSENASYSMGETSVVLDPSNLTNVYGSTMEGNYLNLSKKEVPKDNTEVQVSLGAAQWQGQGSEQDPSSWSVTVDRFTDRMTVRAAHEEAVITCNGEAYTGEMTVELPYDESIWNFSVASADGSAVQFYQVSVTREKYEPLAPSGLTAVPPSSVGGNDGKIQGLDEKKKYEYRSKGESTYHPVAEGSKEITGLTAGTYLVRLQETWENEASGDRSVTIKEPVSHNLFLPEENIPAGVEILECPGTMVEGREFTIRLKLPRNYLLDKVNYSRDAGGMTVSSSFPQNSFQYSQEGEDTIVTITHIGFSGDTTLEIQMLAGAYYQVTASPENGESFDERGKVSFAGEEKVQGGIRYFKEGLLTVTVNLSEDWKGYAGVASLKAFRRGTEEEVAGNLVQVNDEQWYLTVQLAEDLDISYDFISAPADLSALDQVVEKIGDLEQYVDNEDKRVMEDRLAFLSVYQQQPLKNQDMVNSYVTLLEEAYQRLALRTDLSADPDAEVSVKEKEHAYDGNAWKPELTVAYQGMTLAEGTDYRILFPEDMTSPGKKTITVEFLGLYRGTRTVQVEIVRYFTITALAGEHGTIEPAGAVSVREGGEQTFTVRPDQGYQVSAVYVNGERAELTSENQYLFRQVSSDASIEVVFEKLPSETEETNPIQTETQTELQTESSAETELLTETESEAQTEEETEAETALGKADDSGDENKGGKAVKTGDPSRPALYMTAFLISFAALILAAALGRRNRRGQ